MTTFDLNFAADHFALFGIEPRQVLDLAELEAKYRDIQARVHPDKHVHGSDSDQRLSMQWATRINEAYQTLKAPLARARYLLTLRGHDAQIESNTRMPPEFLMEQMELREAVEEARAAQDEVALDAVRRQVRDGMKAEYVRLSQLIDVEQNYIDATALVRQLMFQEKLLHEIDDALEAVFT